jgi:hypothetical protein
MIWLEAILPPGVDIMYDPMVLQKSRPTFTSNFALMKLCDAPESNFALMNVYDAPEPLRLQEGQQAS